MVTQHPGEVLGAAADQAWNRRFGIAVNDNGGEHVLRRTARSGEKHNDRIVARARLGVFSLNPSDWLLCASIRCAGFDRESGCGSLHEYSFEGHAHGQPKRTGSM